MYHQWFNSVQYGEKEQYLINAIKALGSQPIKYGEQPNYDKKMETLKALFNDYINFCETEHKKLVAKEHNDSTESSIEL